MRPEGGFKNHKPTSEQGKRRGGGFPRGSEGRVKGAVWGRSLLGVMKMGFALGVAGLWEKKTAISRSPAEIFFLSLHKRARSL